jgi:glycosyltransferase involved in cell wall biosynthesis
MSIKISVVIPTYKRPKLLTKCLSALAEQRLPREEFEVIVVSDGPDPDNRTFVSDWSAKNKLQLRYLETAEKRGPAAARNLGWQAATAALIAFTDDDCVPSAEWLNALLNEYTGQDYLAMSGFTLVPLSAEPTDFELNTSHLQRASFITANCACTQKALARLGGFDERFQSAWREDSDLEFKLISSGTPILKVGEAVVVHPVREAPWGVSLKEQKKGLYDVLLYQKYPELYRQHIQAAPLWNYYLINFCWLVVLYALITGKPQLRTLALGGLSLLIASFAYRRLKPARKSASHVVEMIGTSMLIPTLSVFWRFYGMLKFRKWLF